MLPISLGVREKSRDQLPLNCPNIQHHTQHTDGGLAPSYHYEKSGHHYHYDEPTQQYSENFPSRHEPSSRNIIRRPAGV
jgi:catalase